MYYCKEEHSRERKHQGSRPKAGTPWHVWGTARVPRWRRWHLREGRGVESGSRDAKGREEGLGGMWPVELRTLAFSLSKMRAAWGFCQEEWHGLIPMFVTTSTHSSWPLYSKCTGVKDWGETPRDRGSQRWRKPKPRVPVTDFFPLRSKICVFHLLIGPEPIYPS